MQCKKLIEEIEKLYPVEYAEEWDNVGLLAGRDDKEIRRVYVALDATEEVITAAVDAGADLLLTHHPLLFGGLKRVTNRDFVGGRVLKLLQHDISCYAMHTNYDVKRMADLACRRLALKGSGPLEVTCTDRQGREEGIGKIAEMEERSLGQLCSQVKEAFQLETVRLFGEEAQRVTRAAVCPGSGKSVIKAALEKGADVLLTGDIGHHDGLDAQEQGLAVIDAGHYGLEHIFIEDVRKYLESTFPDIEVEAAPLRPPFIVL